MQATHVIVWLDHSEAHIVAFNRDAADAPIIVRAPTPHQHQHHRANELGSGKALEHPEYYEKIITTIRAVPEWLIVGPANAKLIFLKHLNKHHPNLMAQLVGIETVDHPSDGQLLNYARKYFASADPLVAPSI